MGFDLNGFVLRPARVASGNATSTGEVTSGVCRDHVSATEMVALGYDITPSRDVEPYADMYRAAVLLRSGTTEEYILWAATTGSLSTLDSDAFALLGDPEEVRAAKGSLTVGSYSDGTDTFFVSDGGGRDLAEILTLTLRRGDTNVEVTAAFASQDPLTGRVVVNSATLISLGGGFSSGRGDTIVSVSYLLAGPTFWWSRNDADAIRFGWDGKLARWKPFQGSTPQALGEVSPETESYKLSVPPSRFLIGDQLPGNSVASDAYALIRAGNYPDSTSVPLNVVVVADSETEGDYPGSGAGFDAVVGTDNGTLLLNPTYATANAGLKLWYNPESFSKDATGDLGELADCPLDTNVGFPCLAPIPGPTDRPFVRIGFRRPLTPVAVDTDADLPATPTSVSEGSFYWSRSTGKILLAEADIKKALPGEAEYDIAYLGAHLFYDGVSLTTVPLAPRTASPCLNSAGAELIGEDAGGDGIPGTGDLFLPRASPLPPPGASGVMYIPDGTGDSPSIAGSPNVRPNGSGLIRDLDGVGDAFFFTSSKAFETVTTKEWDQDLPVLSIKVSRTTVAAAQQLAPTQPTGFSDTSRIQLKRRGITGEALYFIQADVTPSIYSEEARLYARLQEPYILDGTELLRFALDGTVYTWDASALTPAASYSAQEIADSFNAVITGTGSASVVRGRVVLTSGVPDITTAGSVEIGWNTDPDDLSGHAALGFLPGWRVNAATDVFRWQPDTGSSLGLYRSPENLDRSSSEADLKAVGRYSGKVLTKNIPETPFFNIALPPLEDIPGFDDGVHFEIYQELNLLRLSNYGISQDVGVKYDFVNDRLIWTELGTTGPSLVQTDTAVLQLDDAYTLQETLSSAAMEPTGTGFGLYLKQATGSGSAQELTLDVDFLMPGEGAAGQAALIEPYGSQVSSGGGGSFTVAGPFSNPNLSPDPTQDLILQTALYNAVEVGYLLQILTGKGAGIYTIMGKSFAGPAVFSTSPTFAVDDGPVSWRIFEAQTVDVYDPMVVADVKLTAFNHFLEDPWKIRILSEIGTVGGSLEAVVADALASGRDVSIRFGLGQGDEEASLVPTFLSKGTQLGVVNSEGLDLPDTTSPHFTNSSGTTPYFRLRIGGDLWPDGGSRIVSMVSSFSPTIAANTIEVGEDGSGIEGQVRFAADILSDLEDEEVYYDEVLLSAALLSAGEAEIDPQNGQVQLSSSDEATYSGQTVYFVERLISEGQKDVTTNPINGSFLLNKPLRDGQLVETSYFQAATDGTKSGEEIVEYLSFQVRLEEATRVSEFSYTFNPTGRTLGALGTEFVWIGVELQNFAGLENASVGEDSTITFSTAVDDSETVKINYSVLEAFGGEQAFTVSTPPVYRMPFFLEKAQDEFTLEGDRTAEIYLGQLMLLGPVPFYVVSSAYDGGTDLTTVEIWPAQPLEAGSRAPGRDAGFFLSDRSVAITIDPDGAAIAGAGNEGFLLEVDTSLNPLIPADKGQTDISFRGDLRTFARPGHLLEVAGYPYLIVGAALSEDGRYTKINLGTPVFTAHEASATVRISARPIYRPDPTEFKGVGPFLESEGYTLFLLGSKDDSGNLLPGTELTRGVHYEADPATGNIAFKVPTQEPLQPGEKLMAAFTTPTTVGPVLEEDAVLTPVYRAKYLFITTPSKTNHLAGSTLYARYTYNAPDTFFYGVLPLEDYLGEVAETALSKASSATSGGPPDAYPGDPLNSEQGSLGLRGQVVDLYNQDRAARAFIEVYNGICLAFEQVLEAIDGRIIGDRDGKFRFFIGRGKRYAPPGYEDEVTGVLNVRLIWREIINEWANATDLGDGYFYEGDPVYDPTTAFEKDAVNQPGLTDGDTPNPDVLRYFTSLQRARVKNDMDDRILIGFGRPVGLALLFPGISVPGLFRDMWRPHVYSRLFPERTRHFSRLFPGLKAVSGATGYTDRGFYTSGRKVSVAGPEPGETTEQIIKTTDTAIGKIANPALGEISGIIEVTASDRLPRARVWAYYPNGSAALDAALGTTTVGSATLVATPLPLSEFPLDPTTGLPDSSQLISNSGSLYDLVSGDPELSTPGFEVGQRVQYGTPQGAKGTVFALADVEGNGIFVGSVQEGCVLTLADVDGNAIAGGDIIVNESGSISDIMSGELGSGDTIYVVQTIPNLADIPEDDSFVSTLEQVQAIAAVNPTYRIQFDLKVAKGTGEIVDNSLPTRDDAFPIPFQEMFGQKPPLPMTCIEGMVEFVNANQSPLKLPCLKGESKDDTGDVQIPYLQGSETELKVLGEVAALFEILLGSDTIVALPYTATGAGVNEVQTWAAIYPDEVVVSDGALYESYNLGPNRDPATLYSDRDATPVATAGAYTADSAIGDVRPFDLLLLEVGQPQQQAGELNIGMTGILSVGDVSGFDANGTYSKIEPPRFVSTATRGDVCRYTVEGAMGYLGGVYPALSGLFPLSIFALNWTTTLNCTSVAGLAFDEGLGGLTGGLLALVAGGNAIVIRIYSPNPAATAGQSYLGAIVIPNLAAGSPIYAYNALAAVTFPFVLAGTGVTLTNSKTIQIVTVANLMGFLPGIPLGSFYDFTVSIDTYINAQTSLETGGVLAVGSGGGSTSCEIGRDRLTFNERVSFAKALPRGSNPANGDSIELGVQVGVHEITVGVTAGCTVNAPAEVNGGDYFTLLERVGPDPDGTVASGTPYVGSFVPGVAGSENGKLRMMAWEGFGNSTLPYTSSPLTGIVLSAIPSSDLGEAAVIGDGTGTIRDAVASAGRTLEGTRHWIDSCVFTNGGLAEVEAGDVAVVPGGSSAGAVATGTYLVRYAVEDDTTALSTGRPIRSKVLSGDAGTAQDFDLKFGKIKTTDVGTLEIVVKNVPYLPYSRTDCGFPSPATGNVYLYLILKTQYATWDGAAYTLDTSAVYRMRYSAISYDATAEEATFTMVTGTAVDASGTALSGDASFFDAAAVNTRVSGMHFFKVAPSSSSGLPSNNVLGWLEDDVGTALTAGFMKGILGNINPANHGFGITTPVTKTWDKSSSTTEIRRLVLDTTATPAGTLGIRVPEPEDSTEFYSEKTTVLYGREYATASASDAAISGVPSHIALDGMAVGDWEDAHFNATPPASQILECILPGDRFVAGDDLDTTASTAGFFALAGVFLEPSFPRPVTDLALADPHVVASSYPLTGQTGQVGHRDFSSFDTSGGGALEESVRFYVRRIRRFHDVQANISDSIGLLKYAYELRKGDFDSYNSTTRVFTAGTGTYGTATNLGDFDDAKVNVHAGDTLRILDANRNLIDSAEVQVVESGTTLKLRKPGLTESLASAAYFEVYLEQAIVPHEQSNEQLLTLVTDEVVLKRTVDYSSFPADGGKVTDFNVLQDSLVTDWSAEGVQEGDYVVIDAAGVLYESTEKGARPFGDTAVTGRTPFVAGLPAELDDNRGFYKVGTVTSGSGDLPVDGASRFGGGAEDGSDNVVFGEAGAEYAVLPTIGASTLTGGAEGQHALRPTAPAVAGVFADRVGMNAVKSIEPFAYRIIRPSPVFSEDAVELVLFMRERMLSWIEEVRGVYANGRGGDYYVFQRDDHIEDVGSPSNPDEGLGLVSNLVISSLEGLVGEKPFANVSDCLSVLDRRFWVLDTRLDAEGYTDFTEDGFGQRPVLPDLIEDVLDLDDRFRDLRYSWISYRADLVSGSIQAARRASAQLPEELRKQQELIAQRKALK